MPNVTLYIDVDGVICPFGPVGTTEWGSGWCRADAGLLPVAYAQEVVDWLNALAKDPDVRCVWLTSWEGLAAEYLSPAIGLAGGRWTCLTADGGGTGGEWWKLTAIQADIERTGPERIVWIDDQLGYEHEAQQWARFLGPRILLVSPDPRLGLSPANVASISTFLDPPLF